MKTYRVLMVLALVLIASGALAATGPQGQWPCVFGNNQLTSTHTHATNTGIVLPYLRVELWFPTEGGPWSSVVIDSDDNMYTVLNDVPGCFEKWDRDGNLLWSRPALNGWGTDTTGVLGNDPLAWYVPATANGAGDVLLKIDPSDGTVLWTHLLGGGGYSVDSSAAAMDDAGHIYVRTNVSNYLHRVTDLGSSATEDWATQVNSETGQHGAYALWMTSVDPDQTKVYQVTGKPDYKMLAINATTGNVVWTTAFGAANGSIWQDYLFGNPIVDDSGDVYAYTQSHAETSWVEGGVCKFDGDTGEILWTYRNGSGGAFGVAPCTGALNVAQTRLYHEVGNQTIAIDTATGIAQWTLAVTACWQTNGSVIVDASNNPMVTGGGNSAMCHITDMGTYGSLDWRVDPLAKQLMDAFLDYCGVNSDSELVECRNSPGWNGGLYFGVHYNNDPPLAIILPQSIGPLEREIPILGDQPANLGYQLACKGAQGPVSYSIFSGSLPPGVVLVEDYIRGMVSAGAANQYTVTIRANDGVLTADKTYVIDIVDAPLQIGPGLPLGSVGNSYNGGLWIIGGTPPYTVTLTPGKGDYVDATSIGTTGLTLNTTTGAITGVPSAAGSATLEVTVTDSLAASDTKDITVDVVDSRVWAHWQRTKRNTGTSTLPAPRSYPHNLTLNRDFQYKSADTWQWVYEMHHAPLFAQREADADGDGVDDGFVFASVKFASYSSGPEGNTGWGEKLWASFPYDVDPGARYPFPHNFAGWYYSLSDDGWPGVHAPEVKPGVLKTTGIYADELFFSNDNIGQDARSALLDCADGSLLWSAPVELDGVGDRVWHNKYRASVKSIVDTGQYLSGVGAMIMSAQQPESTPGVWSGTEGPYDERTYALFDPATGVIVWTAGQDNTGGSPPKMYGSGGYWEECTRVHAIMKLADEGELVITERWQTDPYYVGNTFAVRADDISGNVTVWTIGMSNYPYNDDGYRGGWTWFGTGTRGAPVVDSTNNVYITHVRNSSGPVAEPSIWAIDGAAAADNVESPGGTNWMYVNSDSSVKWATTAGLQYGGENSGSHGLPMTPCLSRDQRTLYTVAMRRAQAAEEGEPPSETVWHPQPMDPSVNCQLIALHTLNGAVKWTKALVMDGKSGYDYCAEFWTEGGANTGHRIDYALLADTEDKVMFATTGDWRQRWLPPGDTNNPQGSEYDTALIPMAWCFMDTGSDATLMWTRGLSQEQFLDRGGACSLAVTPNYRLEFAGDLDPEWIGVDPTWTAGNRWWQIGVRFIHPDDIHITKVDYNPGVNITFTTQAGANYDVEYADANAYDDTPGVLTWNTLAGGPWAAGGTSLTVTDSTTPSTDFRFYRIKLTNAPFYSNETCGMFKLYLDIDFATTRFFFSVPMVPDSTATVGTVIGDQLPYTNVKVDKLTADTGLYSRTTYTPGSPGTWANDFPIVAGEGYLLDSGDAYAFPHTVILTGFVSGKTVSLSVTRASFAVSYRWMGYSMAKPQTLAGLGLPAAITPFWDTSSEIRLLPLGGVIWYTYRYDGSDWRTYPGGVLANSTPIACGEGIVFVHNGIPGMPDVLPLPTWYYKPPNAW